MNVCNMKNINVLYVCMGNICRSPTAEGVFRGLVNKLGAANQFIIDSAGTHAYHVGESPDNRAQQTALTKGVSLSDIRARQLSLSDFDKFDYILAMDIANYHQLLEISSTQHHHKIMLFLEFAPDRKEDSVPDPYFASQDDFDYVYDLILDASQGFYIAVMK